jgi:arginase family enzyme
VLGGDHSIAEPDIRACVARHGPVGLIPLDTHADTGREVFGVAVSHGTPMFRLVEAGDVDPSRYVQIGLRGYWPGDAEFAWQDERGITSFFMHDLRRLGIEEVVRLTLEHVGPRAVFLSVDVDVLDPAFAPGTGTPDPGGHDDRRAPLGLPHARCARRPRRRGGRGGVPEPRRLARPDRPRR